MEENRDLLITLAIAADGIDRLEKLEQEVVKLKTALEQGGELEYQVKATGVREAIAQLDEMERKGEMGRQDAAAYRQGLEALAERFEGVGGKAKSNAEVVRQAMGRVAEGISKATLSASDLEGQLTRLGDRLSDIDRAKGLVDTVRRTTSNLQLGPDGGMTKNMMDREMVEGAGALRQLEQSGAVSGPVLEDLSLRGSDPKVVASAMKELDANAAQANEEMARTKRLLEEIKEEGDPAAQSVNETAERLEKLTKALEMSNTSQDEAKRQYAEMAARANELEKKVTQLSAALEKAGSAQAKETAATSNAAVVQDKLNREVAEEVSLSAQAAATSQANTDAKLKETAAELQLAESKRKRKDQESRKTSESGGARAKRNGSLSGEFGYRFRTLGVFAPTAMVIFGTMNLLRQATREGIELEKVFTEIQGIIPSRSEMDRFRISEAVIDSAKRYGVNLGQAAQAAKFFAQAGFTTSADITAAMDASLLAVRGAGLSATEAQQLILSIRAITEGEMEALEILDSISRVEARRAISATDLMNVITKVGPIAHQLRGDMVGLVDAFDGAMAMATSIVERTRVSGTNAATTMRFVMARLGSPDVLRQLQQVGGVRLARDQAGQQLRPYIEILHEVAMAHERLTKAGRTAEAARLLVSLGGARQFSGTTALVQGFKQAEGGVLDTARESALAMGDMQARADLAFGTMAHRIEQTKASFGDLGNAFIESDVIFGPLLSVVNITLGSLSDLIRGLDQLHDVVSGRSAFQVKMFEREDFLDTPQVRRFQEDAQAMGMSAEKLFEHLSTLGTGIATDLSSQFGDLGELSKQLNTGTEGFRHLREQVGEELIADLEKVDPQLRDLADAISQTEDPAERAVLQANRMRRAYGLLAQAVFLSSAAFHANTQRLRDQLPTLTGEVEHMFNLADKEPGKLAKFLGNIFTGGWLKGGPLISGDPMRMVSVLGEHIQDGDLDKSIRALSHGANLSMQPLIESFFDAAKGTDAWLHALKSMPQEGASFGRFLDDLAEGMDRLDGDGRQHMIESVASGLERVLQLRSDQDEFGFMLSGKEGFEGMQAMQRVVSEAMDLLISRRKDLLPGDMQTLEDLMATLESPGAAQAFSLANLAGSVVRLEDDLGALILQFWEGERASLAMADAYGKIGLAFDRTRSQFDNTKEFLDGLIQFDSGQISKIVSMNQELERMHLMMTQAAGLAAPTLTEEQIATAIEMSSSLDKQKGQLQAQIQFLEAELTSFLGNTGIIDEEGGILAKSVLGGSERAQQIISDVFVALGEAQDLEDPEAFGKLKLLFAELKSLTSDRVADLNHELDLREREKSQLEAITALEALDAQLIRAKVSNTSDVVRQLDTELMLIDQQYESKRRIVELEMERDPVGTKRALDELAAAEAREKAEASVTKLIQTQGALQQQTMANTEQMLSGVRESLTDVSGFLNASGRSHFQRFLGPAGQAVLDRTTSNLFTELFDPESGALKGLSQVLGESTEGTLKAQVALLETESKDLRLAAADVALQLHEKFLLAGHQVSTWIADATYGIAPGGLGTATNPIDIGKVTSATDDEDPKTPSRESVIAGQVAILASTLISAKAFGSGEGAATGGAIGSLLGAAAGAEWGGALGSFGGPAGTAVGALIGAGLGSLFDGDEDEQAKQTAALTRIDQNTRQTADVLELERRLNDTARGAINVPSQFNLPQFTPGGNSGRPVQVQVTFSPVIHGGNPEEIVAKIRSEIGPMFEQEARKLGL